MADLPDTADSIIDAIAQLREDGYSEDLEVHDGQVRCRRDGAVYDLDDVQLDSHFRFEGDTNPSDESIVLGVTIPAADLKAVLVTAYGPNTPPEIAEFLTQR